MKILGILLFILVFASACNVAEQTAKKTAEENNAVDTPLFTRQSFSFNRASATRSESNNTSQFRIERTGSDLSSAQTVFVDINGTADPTDLSLITVDGVIPTYVIPTRFRVEFAPNETLKNIDLTLFDDLIYEGNEILNLQIIPNNNDYGISGNHQLSLEIRDDESYPIVSFQSAIGVTTEGLTYNLTVEVTNLSKDNIVVPINYDNLNSIAKMGTDIGFSNQSLTFSSGSSLIQTIAIPITNDIYNELSETAVFNLGNPTNANIGLFPTNTLTINNSGPAATYSFSAPTYAVVESGAVSQIQVNLVGTIENELRIPYTLTPGLNSPIHGNDYLLSQGEFVFPAGTASGAQTISLTAIDDDLSEGNENFTITLGSSIYANQVGTGTATVNIADNEFLPQAGIVATNYQTTEGNTFQLPFFITTKSSKPIVIDYTIAGTATSADHSLGATGTITIPPGVRNYSHPVYISPDSVYDQGDTIDISISTLTAGVTIPGANNSSTITINEAGALASVSLTANSTSAVEGSNAQVSFTLSQLSESAQTFSLILDELTALDGSDFDSTTLTTTNPAQCSVAGLDVTFLANQTSCTINIPLPEDLTDEPSEHFEVKILQPQNINLGSIVKNTVEIIDNDVPSEVLISFDGAASVLETIAEGTVQPLHFTLDKISAYDIIINFSLNAASTATSTIDFSIPSYSVTIPKGSTTTSLNITSIADSIFENTTETIILDVTAAPLYTINVAQGSATLNLTESTAVPVVSINAIPAPIPPLTKGVIIQNENNMANIVFKLDHASNEDIIINFATNTVFAECDSVAPFVGPEEFKCADIAADSPELQALINAGATVTIPAGSLEASLDFRILADNLFELGRDEAFELSIASIASANATIDLANDLAIISIGDSDSPSVARFEGDKFLAKNEATNEVMNIPFFLSTPSAADSTFKVEIVQASNPDFYKADENDFLLNNFLAGEVPFAGVNVYPGAPSSPVIYPGSNDVIFAKEVLIPAGSSEFSIDIELNHADIVYEETEQFIIRISQDDTPPAYYPYSVSPVDNEFLVSIVEGSSPPRVELTSTPASVLAEDNGAPHAPATIQAYAAPAPMPATTALNYEFTATSLHQHIDLSFDIIFSGTATYQESILTSSEYMRSDYSVSLLPASGATQSSRVEDVISFTLPAAQSAPATLNDAFRVNVNRDLRYELDETVKAEITNPQEIAIGANGSFEVTITNDDNKPTLVTNMNNSAANPITPWEYENENTLNYSIIGYGIFVGSDASSVPIDIAQTINTHVRQNGTITALPSTVIVLNESNDYHADSEIFPNRTGDYRRLKSIVIDNAPDSEVFNNAPFTKTINLRVPKMKIFTSKGDAYSGSSNNFKGHTCTLFRGRVMCFGSNEFGQLGMGSTVDFGGGAADDISNPTNRIQLGEDAYGHPLYVTELALGESHSCALFSDKKVKCWGLNDKGQLGLGNSFNRGNNPNTMGTLLPFIDLGVGVSAESIVAMRNTTCAMINAGLGIKCWGDNTSGQTSTEIFVGGSTPSGTDNLVGNVITEMGDNLEQLNLFGTVKSIAAGGDHACALLTNNRVYCWGKNNKGQIGINSSLSRINKDTPLFPIPANILLRPITSLSLGSEHSCINYQPVTTHTTFNTRCFGSNDHGQLGLGRIHQAGRIANPAYSSVSLTDTNFIDKLGSPSIFFSRDMNLESTGHTTAAEFPNLGTLPSNATIAAAVDVGVTTIKNQYAQVREPASVIAAGGTYTCGVYDNYFNATGVQVPGKNIKCWGSNKTIKYGGVAKETGVLNNIGSNNDFAGSYGGDILVPYTTQLPGTNFKTDTNFIGDGSYFITGTKNTADAEVHRHFGGDEVNDPVTETTAGTHMYGWVSDFFDLTGASVFQTLNFEMNYLYSNSRETQNILSSGFDGIDLSAGENHACAVLEDSSKNEFDELNDKYNFMCWGANAHGQAGFNSTTCNTLGGQLTCTTTNLPFRKLNYNYY